MSVFPRKQTLTMSAWATAQAQMVMSTLANTLHGSRLWCTDRPPMVFGGYVRDHLMGFAAVDMDVAIWTLDMRQPGEMPHGWRKLSGGEMAARTGDVTFPDRMAKHVIDPEYYQDDGKKVASSFGYFEVPQVNVPVNIVLVHPSVRPDELCGKADFGLCQVACDMAGNVTATEAFRADMKARRLTYQHTRPDIASLNRSMVRAERLGNRLQLEVLFPSVLGIPTSAA